MDAVKFIKENNRMCKTGKDCSHCPANGHCMITPATAESIVSIVEKWSAEHPQKTMLQDFLEKYPNALLYDEFPNNVYPHSLGYCKDGSFCNGHTCAECWSRPIE